MALVFLVLFPADQYLQHRSNQAIRHLQTGKHSALFQRRQPPDRDPEFSVRGACLSPVYEQNTAPYKNIQHHHLPNGELGGRKCSKLAKFAQRLFSETYTWFRSINWQIYLVWWPQVYFVERNSTPLLSKTVKATCKSCELLQNVAANTWDGRHQCFYFMWNFEFWSLPPKLYRNQILWIKRRERKIQSRNEDQVP